MKNFLIFILLLSTATGMSAQSVGVGYTHDNAGNRTARGITINPAPPQPEELEQAITGLADLVAEKAIVIHPNPTRGILSVEIRDYTDQLNAEFRLTDMSGRTITSRKANSGYETFDLSRQATGIYLLQIRINGETVVWKIIKE